MSKKIKILVVTYLPWREDNNIGNSYSNIFNGTDIDKYEFAHIFVRDGMPQNKLCHEYYHISEKSLMKRFLVKRTTVGKYFHVDECKDQSKDQFSKMYNKARILRWEIFFWIRDLVGWPYFWKESQFEEFLDKFKPDIVFGTLSAYPIISNMMCYISKSRNIPLVTYPWDDHYTLNRTCWSPIFWIRRFQGRYFQRKSVKQSSYMYVISNLMQDEYTKIFKKDCRLLFKGHVFENDKVIGYKMHKPINILYMGNIGGGRWKAIAVLAQAVKRLNEKCGEQKIVLNIYTLSPKDKEIMAALNIEGSSYLNDSVPNEKVNETMDGADILLHAEPFEKKDYQYYRASFSTKLVDYFYRAKSIMSIGGMTASTDYLIRNDATIYVNKTDIDRILELIVRNPQILEEYAHKSWDCGVRNHQISSIQKRMYNDFKRIIG